MFSLSVKTGKSRVLRPSRIINVSSISKFVRCEREYYLQKLRPEIIPNEALIRGSLVHSVFSELITKGVGIKETKVEKYLTLNQKLSLLFLKLPLTILNEELESHRQKLKKWIIENNLKSEEAITELTAINLRYGLRGRIDALINGNKIVDLKTGRCHKLTAWPNDHLQINSYGLLLSERLGTASVKGSVLYSGNPIGEMEKEVGIEYENFNWIRNKLNKIRGIDLSKPIKPHGTHQCTRCWSRELCIEVCKKLGQHMGSCQGCMFKQECESFSTLEPVEKKYYEKFFSFIELERKAAQGELEDLGRLSPKERVEKGKAIDNLAIAEVKHNPPYYELSLEGENHSDIRKGDFVIVSDGNPLKSGCTGTAKKVTRHGIVVQTRQRPEKASFVDTYSVEVGFDRMTNALFNFIFRKDDYLKKVVLGVEKPRFTPLKRREVIRNIDQNEALNQALSAEDVFLIQGPPGTGKTYLVAELTKELVNQGERVLISAYTNRGVDNALLMLRQHGFNDFIRIGSLHSIDEKLEGNILSHDISLRDLENVMVSTKVVGTTSTWAASEPLYQFITKSGLLFDTVIIDEASQMLEPQTLSLINLAKRAILIGDHKQLPAVVQSEDAQKSGLAVSMFERLVNTFPDSKKMLTLQYRMNELIEEFPSWKFYDGKMKAATLEIGSQRLSDLDNVQLEKIQDPWTNSLLLPDEPIIYVKTYGICREKVNNLEASIAVKIVKGLMQVGLREKDVAVIAPYRAQVAEIRRRLHSFLPNVDVDTVDRFQGSEREVVIISLTQSRAFNQPIFKDERRWNVAITRAKKTLIIIGHPNSKANRMMSELLSHIQEKGKVVIGELSG